jgi:hypothetical protein
MMRRRRYAAAELFGDADTLRRHQRFRQLMIFAIVFDCYFLSRQLLYAIS